MVFRIRKTKYVNITKLSKKGLFGELGWSGGSKIYY